MPSGTRTVAGKQSNASTTPHISIAGRKLIKAEDIPHLLSLSSGNHETLIEGLTALRNQLSLPPHPIGSKAVIPPQDDRLVLAQAYLTSFPGATHIFEIWDSLYSSASSSNHLPHNSTRILVALISLLAVLLNLLSTHYTYHGHGHAILKTLLQPTYAKALAIYIAGAKTDKGPRSNNDLVLVTMKLWVAMSDFAGGKEKQKVMEAFAWDLKLLSKLLTMRRRTKSDSESKQPSLLTKPDIRTLTLSFLLSPLSNSSIALKHTYLATSPYTDALGLIWKGIDADESGVIRYVFESVWEGIWGDKSVPRKVKIALFGESVFNHLTKLYTRTEQTEDATDCDEIPANLVHHFLLALCTRPNTGVCFQDRGWFPRDFGVSGDAGDLAMEGAASVDPSQEVPDARPSGVSTSGSGGRRIYNKILANVLKMLKVNEDSRQQELALRIMQACPELVAGYWNSSGLTIEPRLSIKWITNIAFFGSVVSLPVPESSFHIPDSTDVSGLSHRKQKTELQYSPVPPPLSMILDNILPSCLQPKLNFSKALSTSATTTTPLMQHCAAQALLKSLAKLSAVLQAWSKIEASLGETVRDDLGILLEDSSSFETAKEGLWVSRRREFMREIRKRLPDFKVILAFVQFYHQDGPHLSAGSESQQTSEPLNNVGQALLAEAGYRLLWMYQKCLPEMAAEARFDVGRVLAGFSLTGEEGHSDDGDDEVSAHQSLEVMRQLHALRLLETSEGFSWSAKSASSSSTNFYLLLKAYTTSPVPAIHQTLHSIIIRFLSQSILFQSKNDVEIEEPSLWLQCLPTLTRAKGTESPDGALLTDERESVIAFLDDCVTRCLKKVYAYMEEMHDLAGSVSTGLASPLCMTIMEQLKAKVEHNLLTPSDILALVTFLRKLTLRLMSSVSDLTFLKKFVLRIGEALNGVGGAGGPLQQYPSLGFAVKREMLMMKASINRICGEPLAPQPSSTSAAVEDFLSQVEDLLLPSSQQARIAGATELIDWIRIAEHPLRPSEIRRIVALITRFHPPALRDLAEHLSLVSGLLWQGLVTMDIPLQFEWLYLHAGDAELGDEICAAILVDALFAETATLARIVSALRLVVHSLVPSASASEVSIRLGLLAKIVRRAAGELSSKEFLSLKGFVFCRYRPITELCLSMELPDGVFSVLLEVILVLDPVNADDRQIAGAYTSFWIQSLTKAVYGHPFNCRSASPWIPFVTPNDLFVIFELYSDKLDDDPSPEIIKIFHLILEALQNLASLNPISEEGLQSRLEQLVSIRPALPGSYVLEGLIANAIEAGFPLGHDGHDCRHRFSDVQSVVRLSSLIQTADARWSRRLGRINVDIDLQKLLFQTSWSSATVRTICGMMYRQPFSRDMFLRWVQSDNCSHRSTHDFAIVLHAFLDNTLVHGEGAAENGDGAGIAAGDAWVQHFNRLFAAVVSSHRQEEMQAACSWCISKLFVCLPDQYSRFVDEIRTELDNLHFGFISGELLALGLRLAHSKTKFREAVDVVVSYALQWAVRYLGDLVPDDDVEESILEDLALLVKTSGNVKAHLAEPVLTAVIQNQLLQVFPLRLATAICGSTSLKPVVVNKQIQAILQHPHFARIGTSRTGMTSGSRDALIDFLYALFKLHPSNTCQPSHVEPLIELYFGTLSISDRKLLAIFNLFESERKTSVASLFGSWSATPDASSSSALEAVQSLDSGVVIRSTLAFPPWRRLSSDQAEEGGGQCGYRNAAHEDQLYDPVFVLLLVSQMFAEGLPQDVPGWIELFRTNVFGMVVRALSSTDEMIREVAITQIVALFKCLESADMQEKPHVMYILRLLKDALPPPSVVSPITRLPTYTTLLIAHSLRAVFHPTNFIYPLTSTFLLQRPSLDTKDVPMLLGMLYSSDDETWKKERGWIVKFLGDGLLEGVSADNGGKGEGTNGEEWKILKRRHTWDLLASLFQGARMSGERDRAVRVGVLEFLANATCNRQATTSLLLKSALLSWIEMQLLHSVTPSQPNSPHRATSIEPLAFAKILENISMTISHRKMDASTQGEWRAGIWRCLGLILDLTSSALLVQVLPIVTTTIVRLGSSLVSRDKDDDKTRTPIVPIPTQFVTILQRTLNALKVLEKDVTLPKPGSRISRFGQHHGEHQIRRHRIGALHTSATLMHLPFLPEQQTQNSREELAVLLEAWGYVVEYLWQASMMVDSKDKAGVWDEVSARLLVWRSFVGEGGAEYETAVPEWARTEVVRNLYPDS